MKLLLIDPNISDCIEAQWAAVPESQMQAMSAPVGAACIETRFEALIGAHAAARERTASPSIPPSGFPWRSEW